MPRFAGTIACNIRAYACVQVEAEDEDAAIKRLENIAGALNAGRMTTTEFPEMEDAVFNPEYDTMNEFEFLEDCNLDEVE